MTQTPLDPQSLVLFKSIRLLGSVRENEKFVGALKDFRYSTISNRENWEATDMSNNKQLSKSGFIVKMWWCAAIKIILWKCAVDIKKNVLDIHCKGKKQVAKQYYVQNDPVL